MGKKVGAGENSKAAAGRARKEETKQAKQAAVHAEARRKEDAEWDQGAKGAGKKEDKAAKAAEKAAKKAEAAALLAAEEKSIAKTSSASAKGAAKPTKSSGTPTSFEAVSSYGASNLDDALALMETVTTTTAQKQQQAELIEQHPERRAKAAFKIFEDRRIPELKKEKPGLRLSQLKEHVFKEWQKSPENPFNQARVAYNATKDEKKATMDALHEETERRLRLH